MPFSAELSFFKESYVTVKNITFISVDVFLQF